MPDTLFLSLIVCTLGRTEKLERLFLSLQQQTSPNFEVILVDQNPEGFLDDIIGRYRASFPILHVRSLPGLSRARNVGLEHVQGCLLAFPDDDCWYPSDFVASIRSFFAEYPAVSAITCSTKDAFGKDSNGKFLSVTQNVTPWNVWCAGNSNGIFIRRTAMRSVGRFNEELGVGAGTPYGAGEETDVLLRMMAKDLPILFVKGIFVHHDQVNTSYDDVTYQRVASYARGYGRTLRLNKLSRLFVAYKISKSFLAVLWGLGKLDFGYARYKWIWVCGALAGYSVPIYGNDGN